MISNDNNSQMGAKQDSYRGVAGKHDTTVFSGSSPHATVGGLSKVGYNKRDAGKGLQNQMSASPTDIKAAVLRQIAQGG